MRLNTSLIGLVAVSAILISGCGSEAEATGLKAGEVYFGKNATREILEVEEVNKWKVLSKHEDDTNYNIVVASETGENIAGYPVLELVAEEINGDIGSSFGYREGREFIFVESDDSLYFRSISDSNRNEIEANLKDIEETDEHIIDISNYVFDKS